MKLNMDPELHTDTTYANLVPYVVDSNSTFNLATEARPALDINKPYASVYCLLLIQPIYTKPSTQIHKLVILLTIIMHVTKTLTLLAGLTTGAMSYVVDAFEGRDCKGHKQRVNVWDNTCRDANIPVTQSILVISYGAGRQRAAFWKNNYCSNSPPPQIQGEWWADGGSDTFLKGRCINLKGPAKAFGSWSA
ncbi:hypothetical protein F66182_1101 [Fusarium sp. NRRL 66182]|nr:hypothetical protein F66182_1101 [Fusarium sp. NRRL 66182]